MNVRVRLFAILRERAGRETVEVELPEGATVAEALTELGRLPGLAEPLARMPVRMAVNREYADGGTRLAAEDELALIPPISGGAGARPSSIPRGAGARPSSIPGGSGAVHAAVSERPLDPAALQRLVADPGAGAIVCFQGVTREVAELDYEAYREMAEPKIGEILAACVERHRLLGAAAEHRVGSVPRGEPAVVVAVAAGHREEAFAGAREAIDRIKAEAPIWKREVTAAGGGEGWVEGQAAPEPEPGRAP